MKSVILAVFAAIAVPPVLAEVPLGDFEVPAGKKLPISFPADSGDSYKAEFTPVPAAGKDGNVLKLAQEHGMGASCGGSSCSSIATVLCPESGVVTAYLENYSSKPLKVSLSRLECRTKDAASVLCPSAGFLATACDLFGGD